MSKELLLKIITPERIILEETVDQVTLPTSEGELTILPGHIPLLGALSSGDIVALSSGEHVPMAVVGGFVEVKHGETATEVTILADFAEHIGNITEDEIAKAKKLSQELKAKMEGKGIVDFEHFETQLERSLTRVKIADKWKTRKYRN